MKIEIIRRIIDFPFKSITAITSGFGLIGVVMLLISLIMPKPRNMPWITGKCPGQLICSVDARRLNAA